MGFPPQYSSLFILIKQTLMVRFFVFVFLWLCSHIALAQLGDTLRLPVFEKSEWRYQQVREFLYTTESDSLGMAVYRQGSVVELLQNTTPLSLRNYSPAHSASFSNRGLAAAHTAVYWNGININASTTGSADLSLIPAGLIESLAFSRGGASSVMGSGSIGGGVHLNHLETDNAPLRISWLNSATTTGNFESSLRAKVNSNGWSTNTALVWNRSQNNYQFINRAMAQPEQQTRENSSFHQQGVTQQLSKKFSAHRIEISLWGVETEREIPPSITATFNDEVQNDLNLKALIAGHLQFNRLSARIQGGYLHDELHYENGSGVSSDIRSGNAVLNADFTFLLASQWKLRWGSNNSLQHALASGNYLAEQQLINNGVYAGTNFQTKKRKLEIAVLVRADFYDTYRNALSPSISANYSPFEWLEWLFSAARNYRIPGFNDRFWHPGGNPDLHPEDAIQFNGGPTVKIIDREKNSLSLIFNGFFNDIENWMQWVPQGGYWGVVSYKSVETLGLNSRVEGHQKLDQWKIHGHVEHVYTSARNKESVYDPDIVGSILPHVPAHKLNGMLGVTRNGLSVYVDGNYTSERFRSINNQKTLESFFLANAAVGYTIPAGRMGFELRGRIHNLFNTEYAVMSWMPMPLRYYTLSLNIYFNQNKQL